LKAASQRRKYIAFALVVVFVISGIAIFSSSHPQSSTKPTASSSATAIASTTSQSYLSVPKLYSDLGYPKVTYSTYSSYLPSKPNFTLEYQTKTVNFQVGSVENTSVIGLDQAAELAVERLNLTIQLQLAYADFDPGTIVNSTLAIDPTWYLFFAQAYDGFWTYGSYGNGAFSVEADIDALTGKAPAGSGGISVLGLANSGPYELDVNSTSALETVRAEGTSISGVPVALAENGTVSFMEPRIVVLGQSSDNAAFQNPLNASLSGQKRLCWVIQLYSPEAGYQGTFAVDAETGNLVSGYAQNLFPNTQVETVSGSLDFSGAKNITVSQETFQINGSILGQSSMVPVVVPNVLILKPGSSSTVDLNFTSTFLDRSMNTSLESFSNPLPGIQGLSADGLPAGVTVQFQTPSVVVPANGTGTAAILISADQSAPSGTYLLELNAAWSSPAGAQSAVIFWLTIWDGIGLWPPPPDVR
jgi:hypothetical protein